MENENAKILWDVPFQLQKAPENGANKIDMAVYNKQTNNWTLLEGTVCQVAMAQLRTKQLRNRKNTQNYVQASTNFTKTQALNKSILFSTFSEATMRS